MGTDKGLMDFRGKKMIEHVLDASSSIQDLNIISNNEAYRQFGKRVYPDIYKNCGPLGGIHSGIYNSKSDWNLAITCDLPFVTWDFIFFLLKKIHGNPFDAIVPVHDGKVEPLCALYYKYCLPKIEAMIQKKELKMQTVLEKLNTMYVEVPKDRFDASLLFRNMNSLSDLSASDLPQRTS